MPVPAVFSKSFLSETNYKVGDDITISVAGKRIPVNIESSFDYFSTLDTIRENQVIVDIDPVFDIANSHTLRGDLTPNEIWLSVSDEMDSISRSNLVDYLKKENPYPIGGLVDRDEELTISKVDPLVRSGWNGLLLISFSSVLLLSVIALVTNCPLFKSDVADE